MAVAQTAPSPGAQQAFEDSFAIKVDKRYLLHNRTPEAITVPDTVHGEVMLPPLAQRVVVGARIAPFERHLRLRRQRHELRVRELTEADAGAGHKAIWVVTLLLLVSATLAYDVFVHGTVVTREAAGAVALLAVAVVFLAWRAISEEKHRVSLEADADVAEGDIEFGVGGTYYDGNEAARRTKQIFTLVAVIVIGAVLPAIAIFVATDAKDFLTIEGGLAARPGMGSLLVSRLVQVVYTAVLALFPALMYFQFDRQRVGTIRGKWVRAIFRMDHRMKTLADVDARYGDELAEASSYSTDSVRFLGGRHSPIVIATILISLGWTVLVMATDSFDFAAASRVSAAATTVEQAADRVVAAAAGDDDTAAASAAAAAADEAATASADAARVAADATGVALPSTTTTEAPASQSAGQVIDTSRANVEAAEQQVADAEDAVQRPFFQLLVPTPSAAVMAFLGAYFFAVYLVLRGYFSGDLRPKLYNQITARLVTVVVLAYLMTVLYIDGSDNRALLAAAFLAGVVPTTVLGRIGQFGSSLAGHWGAKKEDSWLGKEFAKAFGTPRSLTQVDGIDIFECARLESEGITDIPSLAKTDLVSMMVNTRLPIERLVDWTDQAVLILLLDDGGDEELDPRLTGLRGLGVRTASNLVTVARSEPGNERRTAVEALLGSGGRPCPLDELARQIEAEPSMQRVIQWYESERESVCDGEAPDGRGSVVPGTDGNGADGNGDGGPGGGPAGQGGGLSGQGGGPGGRSNGDGGHGGNGDTAVVAWQLTMAGVRSAPAG